MADAPLATISLDISKTLGRIKPMHAVGQPPTLGWNDYSMFHFLKEAHIPYSRLHDTGGAFGKNIYVDIPNLFRDFDADENDPANYDFAFTDLLLAELVKNGVEPFFRLGVTIENKTEVRKYRIFPPKDFAKWARICEHVVAHYNEGWVKKLIQISFVVMFSASNLNFGKFMKYFRCLSQNISPVFTLHSAVHVIASFSPAKPSPIMKMPMIRVMSFSIFPHSIPRLIFLLIRLKM